MLVFKVDTTNFFKYGQKHELRISLPRDKRKHKHGSGSRRASVSEDHLSHHAHHSHHGHHAHHSHHNHLHGEHSSNSSGSRRSSVGGVSNGSVRRHPEGRHARPEVKEVRFADTVDHVKESRFASRRGDADEPFGGTDGSESSSGTATSRSSGSGGRRRRREHTKSARKRPVEQPGGSDESAHGLVTIRMKPDEGGKFGFNVKGGSDQNLPVLVSRVAPNTPADRCYPRLNEGDQVLLINGRDVSAMTHEQVVNFIRASRECHSGELVLTVKQNVYLAEELDEEPPFRYVPEGLPASVTVSGNQTAPLHESMLLLAEGLEAGSLVAQFEQLYRRKPGLTVNEARRQENEKKNRYRDISPYDTTRVILTSAVSGDYINASYVNMDIQASGIINRYIACQGPLAGTCTDFWEMVWEQQSTLIVMLTTVVEQGRVKCHRYWPRLNETVEFGTLQVTCLKEEETPGFAFREFTLINTETQDERHITHMQYLAWPDHGVPDDSTEFLHFVTQVRQARAGMVEPTIVHCSAGIGRTGVLILMETAQCLIEANEPVYPLDVVRTMRDQRAMMIQTASQYRFVCEAIQRVYSEGLVKPLAEYQQR